MQTRQQSCVPVAEVGKGDGLGAFELGSGWRSMNTGRLKPLRRIFDLLYASMRYRMLTEI
jgi:hypothetical protein